MKTCKIGNDDDFAATMAKECHLSNGAYRRNKYLIIRNEVKNVTINS